MLIKEKRLQGSSYPDIRQAPTNYFDFLNYFRGGHTIDNNLTAGVVASSIQASLLKSAIDSGHLTLTKNMANPDEFLADIVLTPEGAEQILTPQDKQHCTKAVELARKSIHENDGKPHPYVGAVVVKDGQVIATGYRGETGEGSHAEYCALRKINDDVDNVDLSGCTVYTTLEPCSIRKTKTPCTDRLIKGKVARVVFGLADKDITVFGHSSLDEAGIEVGLFPKDLRKELLILNKKWSDTRRQPEVMPPPGTSPSSPTLQASFFAVPPYQTSDLKEDTYRLKIHNFGTNQAGTVRVRLEAINPLPLDQLFSKNRLAFPYSHYLDNGMESCAINPNDDAYFVIARSWIAGSDGKLRVGTIGQIAVNESPRWCFRIEPEEQWQLHLKVSSANAGTLKLVLSVRALNELLDIKLQI